MSLTINVEMMVSPTSDWPKQYKREEPCRHVFGDFLRPHYCDGLDALYELLTGMGFDSLFWTGFGGGLQ